MLIWFISLCIFIILEAVTAALVSVWFAIGSLAAMIVSIFTGNLVIQITTFILVSFISLVLTKPFLDKYHNKKVIATNLDMVIGKVGIVTQDIALDNVGEVSINGKRWSAVISEESQHNFFKVNDKVQILSIDGVKLIVREVK